MGHHFFSILEANLYKIGISEYMQLPKTTSLGQLSHPGNIIMIINIIIIYILTRHNLGTCSFTFLLLKYSHTNNTKQTYLILKSMKQ